MKMMVAGMAENRASFKLVTAVWKCVALHRKAEMKDSITAFLFDILGVNCKLYLKINVDCMMFVWPVIPTLTKTVSTEHNWQASTIFIKIIDIYHFRPLSVTLECGCGSQSQHTMKPVWFIFSDTLQLIIMLIRNSVWRWWYHVSKRKSCWTK